MGDGRVSRPTWWQCVVTCVNTTMLSMSGLFTTSITHTITPDVDVVRSDSVDESGRAQVTLKMWAEAPFADYAVAVWNAPDAFGEPDADIQTDAKECVVARNCDGEPHLVLIFDLEPETELQVSAQPQRCEG